MTFPTLDRLRVRYFVGCVVCALVAACGSSGESASKDAGGATAAPAPPIPADAAPAIVEPVLETLKQPPAAAVAPWRAVVDRARYLARRDQQGIIHGRVASHDGRRFLVDETDGAGALAAVVEGLPSALADGDRAAAWGAWVGDAKGGWRWKVARAARLPEREREATPYDAARPGHLIEDIERPPEGAIVIESLSRKGGGTFFQVISAPARPGDGWIVAGRSHWPAAATLILPGEEESYGGQDMRSPRENWQLVPKQSYVVRVRRFRPGRDGKLPIMRAITPPKRVTGK